MQNFLTDFFSRPTAPGFLLIIAMVLALICANTPLSVYYDALLATPVEIRVADLIIAKPLLLWINDGLMALFFFLVGLELKKEFLEGHLSSPSQIVLPAVGAIGGMGVPAAIYVYFNIDDPIALQGWAIPAATDIAFALGILMLLGPRVPISLKVFLASLAIIDDIGAIIIIALFYTVELSTLSLFVASSMIVVLCILNMRNVTQLGAYVIVGLIMWVAVLKSGVHATLAGVVLAFFIPLKIKGPMGISPSKEMEDSLHTTVNFFILPVFAFANAGVNLFGLGLSDFIDPITLGIAFGLFVGKQLGVFIPCWLIIKAGLAKLPEGTNFTQLYGASILCGIGFTMSLFIGSLAFEHAPEEYLYKDRLGILIGSFLSAIAGYCLIRWAKSPHSSGKSNTT